ncbi:hypothetical protein F4782DRAFT_546965 [Xylaria castorea]|nr:hypothetical protein F4782DRAFT_546965 [Xylaria castorea]
MESSPSFEETPPSSLGSEPGPNVPSPKVREWSQFELDTVCALICQHEHRQIFKRRYRRGDMNGEHSDEDWALGFATRLNEALHGADEYQHDIPVADVCELMDFIETKNQNFMAYISRQSTPFRITRSKRYAFQRLCSHFNDAFYNWTITRRERRRNTNIGTDEEISRLDSFGRHLSSPNQDPYLLGAARIQKILDVGLDPNIERGWISKSVYAQRNREGPNINSSLGSAPKINLPQRSILPPKYTRRVYRHSNQPGVIPLPPPPPPLPQPTQYEQMNVHQSNSYDIPSYEGIEVDMHNHLTSPTYYGHPNPTFSASPYPPTSPAYFGHAELRQSIHPTGPRPETPMVMASPAYQYHFEVQQDIYPMNQQTGAPGSLTSPVQDSLSHPTFMGYQYPEPAQENGSFDYGRVLETPASPSSPMYIPDAAPAEMMGTQTEEKEPTPYLSELLEQPNFNFDRFNYGEYSPYWPPSAD